MPEFLIDAFLVFVVFAVVGILFALEVRFIAGKDFIAKFGWKKAVLVWLVVTLVVELVWWLFRRFF